MIRQEARPTILLIGSRGQIGWELVRALGPIGDVVVRDRPEVDLEDADSLERAVDDVAPDCIVNTAAYTRVDDAERERDLVFRVNAEGPGTLAELAARRGALLVHYSTDYVFDGSGSSPYAEEAAAHPLSTYGESKLAGELAVARSGTDALIFRTSWVYGLRGSNFLRTIRRLARREDSLSVVDDQIGAPTWCRAVAEGTAQVLGSVFGPGGRRPDMGVTTLHMTAGGSTTWFGFAERLLRADPEREHHLCRHLLPITTEQFGSVAPRPRYSVLDNARLRREFGVVLPDWREQLDLCLAGVAPKTATA